MTTQETSVQPELVRPAPRRQKKQVGKRRPVAPHLKAVMGPRNLGQALDQAVPSRRRRESAQQSGYDAQAEKITFEPYFLLSSRRRHTSCLSDWSSDVCSSDLPPGAAAATWAKVRRCHDARAARWYRQ